jgi:hypothetical protein
MSAPPPGCEPSYEHCPATRDVEEIKADVKSIYKLLAGTVETPGLMTRIDRLERDSDRHKWWISTVAVAVLGVIVQKLSSLFK